MYSLSYPPFILGYPPLLVLFFGTFSVISVFRHSFVGSGNTRHYSLLPTGSAAVSCPSSVREDFRRLAEPRPPSSLSPRILRT